MTVFPNDMDIEFLCELSLAKQGLVNCSHGVLSSFTFRAICAACNVLLRLDCRRYSLYNSLREELVEISALCKLPTNENFIISLPVCFQKQGKDVGKCSWVNQP